MDSADLIDIVPMPTTIQNSSKPARPKSAVRRKTIDRDLDMIEGLDFNKDQFVDDETEVPFEIHELEDGKFFFVISFFHFPMKTIFPFQVILHICKMKRTEVQRHECLCLPTKFIPRPLNRGYPQNSILTSNQEHKGKKKHWFLFVRSVKV